MNKAAQTLRQAVRYATLNKQERTLREAGFLEAGSGVLTEQGRRIVVDYLWDNDKDLQKKVTAMVAKTLPKSKKCKNEDDEE